MKNLTFALAFASTLAFGGGLFADIVAERQAAERKRGEGKRGWLAYEAERNAYFPAQNMVRVREIASYLPPRAQAFGDPEKFRDNWDAIARTPEGRAHVAAAEKELPLPIAPLSLENFKAYSRTGSRAVYRPDKRDRPLAALVLGECLENKGRFVAKAAQILEAICCEPSWVAPYEGGIVDAKKPLHGVTHYIDLTSASRASLVATAYGYLRDKLPEATKVRVLDVLRGRVFDTFLRDARRKGETTPYHNWWMPDRFNWSAVCHNGCTTAILAAEDDPIVRAEAIEASERLMAPCFLDGFLADGMCEEGMGYWNYGFGNFLRLAATVKAQTSGRVDFCKAFPRARLVAGFGANYRMGEHSSPPFADGNGAADRNVLSLIYMNWPDMYRAEVRGLNPIASGDLTLLALRNFGPFRFVEPPSAEPAKLPRRNWFACAEMLIARANRLSFAIKGGTNADRHNHNDAGSYVIDINGREVAGDPGNENYTARTFSRKRYESKVLNSFAHPVPRVGGELQGTGPAFGAKLISKDFTDSRDTIVYDLAGAYPAKVPVRRLVRTAVFDRSEESVTIADEVEFETPSAFDSPVIAWGKITDGKDDGEMVLPCADGKTALLVTFEVEGGEWKMVREFVPNPARTQPTRAAVTFKRPVTKAKVTTRYRLIDQTPQMGIMTPKAKAEPSVNGARVFGVRPGNPVFWRLAVSGAQPLKVTVSGLPGGVVFDSATRLLTGTVAARGNYDFTVTAENAKGRATRKMTLKVGDAICLTPPLGWNSWNCWGQEISDEKMRRTADAMVESGLADHGWSYVVVDDCWRTRPTEKEAGMKRPNWIADMKHMYGAARKADGSPETNSRFPDMKAMAGYIHSKGLRAGLYSVPGALACCWTYGSWQHEAKDAAVWADWGIDLVKYDWCYGDRQYADKTSPREWQFRGYKLMGDCLAAQKRDMVYNVCNYGRYEVTKWAKRAGGHYWRTNDDLKDTWPLLIRSINENLDVADAAGPDGWNDPDMLVVGPMRSNGFTKSRLTPNEQYTHISLWAMMASPLFIGCDLERLRNDPLAFSLLTNDEVLAIDQDELGVAGRPVVRTKDYDVWVRPLANGAMAVAVFNRTWESLDIYVDFAAINAKGELRARDVWAQRDIGAFGKGLSVEVFGHATRLITLRR